MMAKESACSLTEAGTLDTLGAVTSAAAGPGSGLPPVHAWNPPFCGDIDMRIARDGTWFYAGTPIARPALVRLFSSVLRRDPDGIMLVTPVEKVRIVVEDAPFVAVEMEVGPGPEPVLRFRTNVDEWVEAGPAHPLRFEPGPADGLKPYLCVRSGLEALVKRPVFLDLADRGEVRRVEGVEVFGVASGESFFPMLPAADLAGLL